MNLNHTDENLFAQIRDLPRGEQKSRLHELSCDQAQINRVQLLLYADQSPDSLLDATAIHSIKETAEDCNLPKTIGDFEILGELGRGGMGVVYVARQKSLKRKVALKVLSSGLGLSSKAILRFRREAEAAGKLHHTNIVPIYTTGEDKGIHFYAMELIDGPSLDQVIKIRVHSENGADESLAETASRFCDRRVEQRFASDGVEMLNATHPPACGRVASHASGESSEEVNLPSFPRRVERQRGEDSSSASSSSGASTSISTSSGTTYFDEVATMIADVAEALDHAHEHGVIHRDVKPSNLLLGPDGRLSINDFGLARMLEQPGMTVSGEFVGSPLYMSPEQITAGRVQLDHRTDIYSLGATLYELLTHQPPFPGQTRDQVLSQILHKVPSSSRKLNRKIPIDLDTICMKAIDKDPDRRYQTAAQLADDLRKYVNRHAISARRTSVLRKCARWIAKHPSQAFLTILLAASLVVASWLYQHDKAIKLGHAKELHLISCLGGDTDSAREHMLEAERLGATKGWLLLAKGQIRLYEGNFEAAFASLDDARKSDAPRIPTQTSLAIARLYRGDEKSHEHDLKYIKQALDNKDLVPETPQDYLYLSMAFQYADPRLALKYLEHSQASGELYEWIQCSVRTWAAIYEPDKQHAVHHAKIAQAAARSLSNTFGENPRTAFNGIWAETVASICLRRQGDQEREKVAIDTAQEYVDLANENSATSLQHVEYILRDEIDTDESVSNFLKGLGNTNVDYYVKSYRMIDCERTGDFMQVKRDYDTIERDQDFKYPLVALTRLTNAIDETDIEILRKDFRIKCSEVFEEFGSNVLHADLYWAAAKLLGMPEEILTLCEHAVELRANTYEGSYIEATRKAIVEVSQGKRNTPYLRSGEDQRVRTYLLFALGVESLSEGDRELAKQHFEACSNQGVPAYYVCQFARAALAKLQVDPTWPKSIPTKLHDSKD